MEGIFDWNEVVIPSQRPIAISIDEDEITISQRACCEEDQVIFLTKGNVLNLVRAVLKAADMEDVHLYRQNRDGSFAACSDIDLPIFPAAAGNANPKDPTAAERMRRHRSKKRACAADPNTDEMGSGPHE